MATVKLTSGTRTNLTTTALDSLASTAYVSAGTIDVSADDPLDIIVEVEATPGTVSSNKQLVVFARTSMDNIDFTTGPVSGTTNTNEANLKYLGVVPLNTNATLQRNSFSVVSALGFVPPYLDIVCKNETGAALAATGHAVNYTLISGSVA